MAFHIKKVAFQESLLSRMAADLLAEVPDAGQGDLSGALVVLPSARACRSLGHELLEQSGRSTLLLPRAVTVRQLVEEEAAVQGLDAVHLPDDRIRPLLLAHRLQKLDWLRDRPENGPGLAREFINFFDEARRYGRDDLLLGEAALEGVLAAGHAGAAEVLTADMRRLGEVWALYRRLVPRDGVDLLAEAARGAAAVSRAGCDLMAVAGFGRLDHLTARLLQARAASADQAQLYVAEAAGPLSRFFCATWGPAADLDPLAPTRKVTATLTGQPLAVDRPAGSLRQRLDGLGDPAPLWAPDGPLEAARCADQEQESLVITDRIVKLLQQPGAADRRTAVVTNDPMLAARVVAQLRDAGIDVDDTLGKPLASLPAGLLLRFLLRAALTGLRPEALLEVLTHPYTRRSKGQGAREFATLGLERMLRSLSVLPTGPGELLRLARERDAAAQEAYGATGGRMEEFVQDIVSAMQPVLDVARGEHPAGAFLAALRRSWQLMAPDRALTEDPAQPDVTAAHRLLADLERDQAWLPRVSLAEFAADLGRLLAEANVPPHRTRGLPVLVAGMVEARLETVDNLIIAGLNEGRFPTRRGRPLFLDSRVRAAVGLPVWKDALARDAELFLRLLHNGRRVLLTWSAENQGQPLLPSPLVERLLLGHPRGDRVPLCEPEAVWRREPAAAAPILERQEAFVREELEVPALARSRTLDRLSWSGLRTWRECPYRFLLERGFALRREEEVQEAFSRRDLGSLIHEILRRFLDPDADGWAALDAGDAHAAGMFLADLARQEFTAAERVLPERVLWLNAFLEKVPPLVDFELKRFHEWRPALLEQRFEMTLENLAAWMDRQIAEGQAAGKVPGLRPEHRPVVLEGTIDRVDEAVGGGFCAVIDYKTGKLPAVKQVTDLRDLQILLYSLAVETGAAPVTGAQPIVGEACYYAVGGEAIGPPAQPHFSGDRQLLLDAASALVDTALQVVDRSAYGLIPRERAGEGPAQLPCRFCDFQGSCRLEERPLLPAATRIKVDKLPGTRKRGWA